MNNKCQHIKNFNTSINEIKKLEKVASCAVCKNTGPNLWICLQRNCLLAGCSEQIKDHSTAHFKANNSHSVHMNLSSQRIWCYLCEKEVFIANEKAALLNSTLNFGDCDLDNSNGALGVSDNEEYENDKVRGLVGLQNIANTCYMNSALQALSNIQPLTYYFLDCGDIIEHYVETAVNKNKAGLAKSYYRLIKDIWCNGNDSKDFIAPRGILYGIRSVHSMFRGFQQHDTQEFLRCFMDQLHEELKETDPIPLKTNLKSQEIYQKDDEMSNYSSSSASQSEGEYETCDSGVSEQSSLFEDSFTQNKHYSSLSFIYNSSLSSRVSTPYGYRTNISANNYNPNNDIVVSVAQRSIISDVFDGKLLSSVQCLTCDRISTREETFQDLSLPIPHRDYVNVLHHAQNTHNNIRSHSGAMCNEQLKSDGWFCWVWNVVRSWLWGPSVTLHDCMASFFSADELKGDNMYSCSKCNKLRTGVKYSRVLDLPEALCVHLKRFRHDLSYSSKISSYIHFPLVGFDMRPYLHKDCKSNVSLYNLVSVICHHGTVGGGHYTCFAKNDLTGNWYEFDDQHVTEVSADVVQNCQAYVLFYQKHNPQMDEIRTQAREFSKMNPQFSDIRFFVSREWINRFNTFAEPGPINNWAILCPHGGVPPHKATLINKIAVPLSQPLWDFLYKKFGGGPVVNRLFECDICKRTAENLQRRQTQELGAFTKFHDDFQNEDDSTTIYAISMAWFRKWQLFARGITTKDPGPINNSAITSKTEATVNNVLPGSDYAQLNTSLWKFFYNIYGGGPEIVLRGSLKEETSDDENIIPENNMIRMSSVEDSLPETSDVKDNMLGKPKNVTFQSGNTVYDNEKANMYSRTISIDISEKHLKQSLAKKKPKVISVNHSLKRKTKRNRNGLKSSGFFGLKGTYNANEGSENTRDYNEDSGIKQHSNEPDFMNTFQNISPFQYVLPCSEDKPIQQQTGNNVFFKHDALVPTNGVKTTSENHSSSRDYEFKTSKKLHKKQKRNKGKSNAVHNHSKEESGTSENEI
ncbi:ubiquitin carboxyl-terminal hydrolase 20 [Episyrphus balteatus]|uniref:ubiquitin carboxyl-terminal hydrolase 20 n=1 Tax=Episyrphus balteatus TaxID=286459 RepID=UPI002486CA73|nr:ubiquitin carboxyl-terminal hydrolase 20 [Episyrphus balteatus]